MNGSRIKKGLTILILSLRPSIIAPIIESVKAFMGCFSPEEVVTVTGVKENHGQQDDHSDQQQRLRFRRSRGLAKRKLKGHDIRPHADRDAEITCQKYAEAKEKGAKFPARVQVAPDGNQQDQAGER
jgi:hypothetical protein